MKILVVSDTHRRNENYFTLLEMHHPDMVIHCGDVEGSEYALSQAAECPVQMVTGNNDFFSQLPRELELNVGPYKVWVTHGHNYYVSLNTSIIKEEAQMKGADVVIFGQTHKPLMEEGQVLCINPGSLSYPRQPERRPSYMILNIDRDNEWHLETKYK